MPAPDPAPRCLLVPPLTDADVYSTRPVWSPDGSMLAFAAKKHGNFDVFIMPAGGGEEQLVFVAGGVLEVQPGMITVLADTAIRGHDLDEAKALDAPLMRTGAGIAGNITGNAALFAPTAFIPGANTYTGATTISAGVVSAQNSAAFGTTAGGVTRETASRSSAGSSKVSESPAMGGAKGAAGGAGERPMLPVFIS